MTGSDEASNARTTDCRCPVGAGVQPHPGSMRRVRWIAFVAVVALPTEADRSGSLAALVFRCKPDQPAR